MMMREERKLKEGLNASVSSLWVRSFQNHIMIMIMRCGWILSVS